MSFEAVARANHGRVIVRVLILITLFLFNIAFDASAGTYASITDLVLTPGHSLSSLHLAWYSTANTTSLVQIAKKSDMSGSDFPEGASTSFYSSVSTAASGYYTNKCAIRGLLSSTEYVYRLGDGANNWTVVYPYTTRNPNTFSFLAAGDPQIGSGNESSDSSAWSNTLSKAITQFSDASFIMTAGDQVETNSSESQYSGFFSPAELKSLPVAPALGNHDTGANNYSWHFYLPNLSNRYGVTSPGSADYYFTYGNTLFIVLNTNNTNASAHKAFIRNTVAQNPGLKWRIVMNHQSIYSSGPHSTKYSVVRLRDELYPIMDEFHIDMVLSGHDHQYTRTHQMFENQPYLNQKADTSGNVINPTGTFYVALNSASGSKYYTLNSTPETYAAVRSQLRVPSFSRISISDISLNIKTYRTDSMAQTDAYSIVKHGGRPR